MNLDISTSIGFVKERSEKTAAVQTVLARPENGGWVWALKPLAAWTEDLRQPDGAADGTPAQKAVYSLGVMAGKGAALETRYKISRLEDDCVRWYAEATAVFPAGTDNGDLIRSEVPTDYTPAKPPAAAKPVGTNPVAPAGAGPG